MRQTIRGSPSYGSLEFSNEFKQVKTFIQENELLDHIDIAIPRIVLEELLRQKVEQYNEDISNLSIIRERLSQLPETNFDQIILPREGFDCQNHVNYLLEEFIRNSEISIIDITEQKLGHTFKEIIKRAIEKRPPFRQSKNSSDTGFKDVVIWESILGYENLGEYDKVIFVSNDSDFNEICMNEFQSKINKYISINPSAELVISELKKDYESIIQEKEFLKFSNTDYFKDHLAREIYNIPFVVPSIRIDGEVYKIEDIELLNNMFALEFPKEDDSETAVIIVSLAKAKAINEGSSREVSIKIKTYLDDTKGIQDTLFEVNNDEEN